MNTNDLGEVQGLSQEGNKVEVMFPSHTLELRLADTTFFQLLESAVLYERATKHKEAIAIQKVSGHGRIQQYGFWTANGAKQRDLSAAIRSTINYAWRQSEAKAVAEETYRLVIHAEYAMDMLSNNAYPVLAEQPML